MGKNVESYEEFRRIRLEAFKPFLKNIVLKVKPLGASDNESDLKNIREKIIEAAASEFLKTHYGRVINVLEEKIKDEKPLSEGIGTLAQEFYQTRISAFKFCIDLLEDVIE